ncbi:MAG: hypothetical protein AAF182_00730 [Pseudomonadota bacterium]
MPHPRSSEILDSSLGATLSKNPHFLKNWEVDIGGVKVESCTEDEDPLGYRAVFFFARESARALKNKSFVIGASFLAQRAENLRQAGYEAPMTQKAIDHIEKSTGKALPFFGNDDVGRFA